jgi:hypothetical protein
VWDGIVIVSSTVEGETMKVNLTRIGLLIVSFFDKDKVQQMARLTKFVRRGSVLSGPIFLQALVFACLEHPKVTLSQMAQACLDLGVAITPQGLDERLNSWSVVFMQTMFSQAMSLFINRLPLPLGVLHQFSRVNLIDSSIVPLPEALATEYPGSGGNASKASLKMRLVFDFLYGNLQQFILAPGIEPDQNFSAYLSVVQPGSLNLMDLGHFNLAHFKQIAQAQAYFLSRYHVHTGLLTDDEHPLDLLPLLQRCCQTSLDQPVRLSQQKQYRLPCRLVAFRLKQEVAEQRRRRAKADAQRRGQTVSPRTLALLDYAIYVTNVPQAMLSGEQVALLYRVRWQIELIFKLWKSYSGLRQFASLRRERLLTELYARMIGLVLTHFLVAPLRMPQGAQANCEISPVQVRQIFRRFARSLNQSLGCLERVVAELTLMLAHIQRFGFKQKRQKKPNICHALALVSVIHQLDLTLEPEFVLPPLLA